LTFPNSPGIPPNGAFQAIRGIRYTDITDGSSHTLLIGDKHVPLRSFGMEPWDTGIFDGHHPAGFTRAAGPGFPLAQGWDDPGLVFGSYHPGICQFAFCDGHVQALVNTLDPVILGLLAQRNDGLPVPPH
jgi:prepilin-type processing-associated H-X9-DG protein